MSEKVLLQSFQVEKANWSQGLADARTGFLEVAGLGFWRDGVVGRSEEEAVVLTVRVTTEPSHRHNCTHVSTGARICLK